MSPTSKNGAPTPKFPPRSPQLAQILHQLSALTANLGALQHRAQTFAYDLEHTINYARQLEHSIFAAREKDKSP